MKIKNKYNLTSQIWCWPGDSGWHFISLDKKMSSEIKRVHGKNFYGSGFIKIEACIGKSFWQTALFPYKKEGIYLISIKKDIRKKESLVEGERVKVFFTVL